METITATAIKKVVIASQASTFCHVRMGKHGETIPMDFTDRHDKNRKVEALRKAAREVGATEVLLVVEAWAVVVKVDRGDISAEEIRGSLPDDLADAEGRIEVLICQHERKGQETKLYVFDIVRTKNGEIIGLPDSKEIETFKSVHFKQWILNPPSVAAAH